MSDWQTLSPPAEFIENNIPRIEVEEIPNCPVCSSDRFAEHTVGFDYEIQTCSNPWRFVICDECHHIWLNPRPAIDALSIIYPPTYYAYNYKEKVNPIALKGKEFLDRLKMKAILGNIPHTPKSFLDIGCGDGRFLKVMENYGVEKAQNYGLELDPNIVKPLADEGYQVLCERVEDTDKIPARNFDLVTMFHVIEHVDDPGVVIKRVADWLSDDGIFAIETPNIDSLDKRIFEDHYWGGYHIPRHWNLFNAHTLTQLLEQNGLRVVDISYQTGHSFWMYSFHHWLRYEKNKSTLGKMFDPLKGLPFLISFTGFDKLRGLLGFKTSAMLVLARRI